MRLVFVVLLFAVTSVGQEDFISHWNDFAVSMNRYIGDLNHGENNYSELKSAVRKWRALEKQQGWDKIH